jgi:hypothetical protein
MWSNEGTLNDGEIEDSADARFTGHDGTPVCPGFSSVAFVRVSM